MAFLLTSLCFELDTFNGAKIAELIREGVGFEPTCIATDDFLKMGAAFHPERHLPKLEKSKKVSSVRLETEQREDGPYFRTVSLGSWAFQVIYWRLDSYRSPDLDLVSELVSQPGFNAGYMADADDVFWQSEANLSTYGLYGKPHDHLPKIKDEVFGGYKVDVLKNLGASYLFPGMWLQSAWRMWFSGKAFDFLPKQRLLSFRDSDQTKELSNGVVFIQLYSDPASYASPESRARQQSFRDWVGIADLAAQAGEYSSGRADPSFEIEEGEYEHGGIRMFTYWLDEEGNLVRKSHAVKQLIQELDEAGSVVWSEGRTA